MCDVYSSGAIAAQEGALEESCEATCEATHIDNIGTPSIEARVAAAAPAGGPSSEENEGVPAVVDAASAVVAASDASPAPQVEGAAAAPAGGSSSVASAKVTYSSVIKVDDYWNPNKGHFPLDKNVIIVDSTAFGPKLGPRLSQAWKFGLTANSRNGENRLTGIDQVLPGVNAFSIDGWVKNEAGRYANHVTVGGMAQFAGALGSTPKNYVYAFPVTRNEVTKKWELFGFTPLLIRASVLLYPEGAMAIGTTASVQGALFRHPFFMTLPNEGVHADAWPGITDVESHKPGAPRAAALASVRTLLQETSEASQQLAAHRMAKAAKEAEASKKRKADEHAAAGQKN